MDDFEYVVFVLIRQVDQDIRLFVKGCEAGSNVCSF